MLFFVPGDLRDQTRLPCEFGANPFSSSGDILCTNKKVTDSATKTTLRNSLRAVIDRKILVCTVLDKM